MIVNIECNVGDTLIILVAVIDVVGLTVIYEYIQNIKNTIFILVVIVEYDYTAFIKYLFAYSTCCFCRFARTCRTLGYIQTGKE